VSATRAALQLPPVQAVDSPWSVDAKYDIGSAAELAFSIPPEPGPDEQGVFRPSQVTSWVTIYGARVCGCRGLKREQCGAWTLTAVRKWVGFAAGRPTARS
jgi:hypothetical protein